jgi:hypothetical protein
MCALWWYHYRVQFQLALVFNGEGHLDSPLETPLAWAGTILEGGCFFFVFSVLSLLRLFKISVLFHLVAERLLQTVCLVPMIVCFAFCHAPALTDDEHPWLFALYLFCSCSKLLLWPVLSPEAFQFFFGHFYNNDASFASLIVRPCMVLFCFRCFFALVKYIGLFVSILNFVIL